MYPVFGLTGSGLIDVHVHMNGVKGAECAASAGIIAVRNAGLSANAAAGCGHHKRLSKPIIISSCWALYKSGGYGARFGIPVDTKSRIKAEIVSLKKAGADIIKVMASGIVSFKRPGTVTPGGFDPQELDLIVEEARALGLSVMAHANGEHAIIAAARAGVQSIEHGFFMTARALEALAKKNVYWTPTVGALVRAAESGNQSPASSQFISGLVGSHLRMIGLAHDIGVPLALGTDCVLPDPRYRSCYDSELGYFEQSGISSDAVMKIACESGGRLLGLVTEFGCEGIDPPSPGPSL